MDILIAIAHIAGSVIVVILISVISVLISSWELARNQKIAAEEMSLMLGVKVEDLEKEELWPKILEVVSEKFSSELLRNRVSDFCGLIRMLWAWIGILIQVGVLLIVIWFTVTDSIENAAYAWFIVSISIIFGLISVAFSLICKLLTGRYPGQAKQARKEAAEWVKYHG